ncbi:MAG: SAP domain-containing protein [Betaproteobacteria bacterium]|nr:SAP domain-containing protein [Betaproteobacteria bacterium]
MKMNEIKEIAKSHHIKPHGLSKTELVRGIQRIEGNFDCFATASDKYCNQIQCIWREDCFDLANE